MPEPTNTGSSGAVRLRKPASKLHPMGEISLTIKHASLTCRLLHSSYLDTAFKQQRLKAWQPILTPRTVLPTFFLLGLIFIPLGAWLFTVSNSV